MNEQADEMQPDETAEEENPAENTQSVPNQTHLDTGKDSQRNEKPNDNQTNQMEQDAGQQNDNEMKEPDENDDKDANNSDKNYVENTSSNKDAQLSQRESQQAKKSQPNETNKRTMGMRNENRQLAEENDSNEKKAKNFNIIEEKMDDPDHKDTSIEKKQDTSQEDNRKDFRHIKETESQFDEKIFDAATEQQQQKQKNPTEFNEMNQEEEKKSADGVRNKRTKNEQTQDLNNNIENLKQNNKQSSFEEDNDEIAHKMDDTPDEENETKSAIQNDEMDVGDSKTSVFVSSVDNLLSYTSNREFVEKNLEKFRQLIKSEDQSSVDLISKESHELWQDYELLTQQMSKELCEQLRLILEPTICSKLKGDYKSGKRLNMKRVIEYIATEYRKDKIWLRRIKPNKRDYQVMLAIDNSSSMSDNHCIQLAYETIATLANAFNYLEGNISLCYLILTF